MVIDGDLPDVRAGVFSLEEFNFLCTSLLYGGFPVILFGDRSEHDDRHAICLTGFRSEGFDKLPDTGVTCVSSDSCVKTYYGHDVSLGINVRFKVFPGFRAVKGESHSSDKKEYFAILRYYGPVSEPSVEKIMRIAGLDPGSVSGDVIKAVEAVINEKKSDIKKGNDIYEILEKLKATESCKIGKVNDFEPGNIVVAFPRQIRSDPRLFLRTANDKLTILTFAAIHLSGFFISRSDKTRQIFWPYKQPLRSLVYSIRYISLSDYLGTSLLRILPPDPMIVSKVRRRILEGVRHMPEFIGVLRVGILFDRENEQKNGPELTHPLMDIIYDTSETDGNAEVFATIKFLEIAADIILLSKRQAEDYISRFNEVKKLAGESLNKFSPQDLEKLKHFGTEICAFDENFEPEYLGADKPEFLVDFLLSNGRFN
ncbi:MAG TPA: hypothetical protein HPQ00_12940 [Magnetococcales bacterium]|nr:hypothetical protein [Magnetococcales bacterium]